MSRRYRRLEGKIQQTPNAIINTVKNGKTTSRLIQEQRDGKWIVKHEIDNGEEIQIREFNIIF